MGESVDRAVGTARSALGHSTWSRLRPRERAHLLTKLADALEEHGEEFAQIESLDTGETPQRDEEARRYPSHRRSPSVLRRMGDKIEGATSAALCIRKEISSSTPDANRSASAASLVPWDYPLLLAAWKLAPALAAGNTVILKPSEEHR